MFLVPDTKMFNSKMNSKLVHAPIVCKDYNQSRSIVNHILLLSPFLPFSLSFISVSFLLSVQFLLACRTNLSSEKERQKRQEDKQRTTKQNTRYYMKTSQTEKSEEAMSKILEMKAPLKEEKKKRVPVGQRVLGPGFLERYGTGEKTAVKAQRQTFRQNGKKKFNKRK